MGNLVHLAGRILISIFHCGPNPYRPPGRVSTAIPGKVSTAILPIDKALVGRVNRLHGPDLARGPEVAHG